MPIYEYRCESCGTDVEKLQKISDPPLRDCPACGKPALVKRVSASSFRLKGSGWYETDFKTGKKKNGAADDAAATASSDGTGESGKAAAGSGDGNKSASTGQGKGAAAPESASAAKPSAA